MSYVAMASDHFDAMCEFYGRTLGFAVVEEWDRARGRGCRFDLGGGLRLEILDNARERHPVRLDHSERVHVVVEVPDVDAAWLALNLDAARPVTTSWNARLFQVRDPDGVPVTYLQWLTTEDGTAL